MKKIKIELKYIMIVLVVIAGVLLAVSGNFSETKTMTAYKTTVDGSDSARVAKWDVVGISRKEAQTMELESGFAQEITTNGDWYFEIENLSEVNAMINKSSTVTFRLMHDSFVNFEEDKISWNFLDDDKINGDDKINEIKFDLYAYDANLDDVLIYVNKNDTSEILSYDQYLLKSEQDKLNYVETFTAEDSDGVLVCSINNTMTEKFVKTTSIIDGVNQTYYQLTFDLSELTDDESILGFGETRHNTTLKLHWEVPAVQCTTHVDENTPLDGCCDVCGELMSSSTFSYTKYIISETASAIDGYTIYSDENGAIPFLDANGDVRYIFASNDVDFFNYQKYTSTLGGEPMYEFLNDQGTQTILVPHSKLTEIQTNTINRYTVTKDSNVVQAWEKLTYAEYVKFKADYADVESSLSYMSYGISLQIIFNLTVEQVD